MGPVAPAAEPMLDPDLDRPLDAASPAAENTDDLLAELAGEQIDRLLAGSDGRAAEPLANPSAVSAPVNSPSEATDIGPTIAAEAADVSASDLDAVLAEAAARLAVTDMDVAAAVAEPPPAAAALSTPPPPTRAEVPLLLKPLVWANAPLAACPERVREAIGKIALVTFVNALGVLAYTLAFHRPR